jgi:sigma-B regulation protein RsbU (phosphoserine phosphatase)
MRLIPLELESKLRDKGLWPESRIARGAVYVLALDILFFVVQVLTTRLFPKVAASLGGWVSFLSGLAIMLFVIVGYRWLRKELLWRLRNRLIVTYVFIGVIPVILLLVMSLFTLYLLAGQFASFVVTSEIESHLRSMEAANRAISNELAGQVDRGERPTVETVAGMRSKDPAWSRRQVCIWHGRNQPPSCAAPAGVAPLSLPVFASDGLSELVRDKGGLFLRSINVVKTRSEPVYVISSEPLDRPLTEEVSDNLGEVTLYKMVPAGPMPSAGADSQPTALDRPRVYVQPAAGSDAASSGAVGRKAVQLFIAGAVPEASSLFDREITFGTPLQTIDWAGSSAEQEGDEAGARVQTRLSRLYGRLFGALGPLARGIEYILLSVAIIFGIIELLALFIGTRLTRSITYAVAQLYDATKHINRGDFSHRIEVKSNDQLATLANSFNSMTASIERLIQEQKEKQRLENELSIAQEVQAQLFPKEITQLESLEVHGFCRPARTVSGDYYDFLALSADKMILAVGDVSGKGISAALLMATIHSAVRAYSLEGIPLLRETAAVGVSGGGSLMLTSELKGIEASPGTLLGLLNHQLYESTPQEKYATLFLGIYDGATRQLTYTNGGHLPPILLSEDGSIQQLTCGGTVVGLFPDVEYPEAAAQLRRGDIFLAYSDGVTEPENDYGEFGEERLIEIVRENRHLPLARITEIVTAAVDDWIGDNEQPDDVTLVLARAR